MADDKIYQAGADDPRARDAQMAYSADKILDILQGEGWGPEEIREILVRAQDGASDL